MKKLIFFLALFMYIFKLYAAEPALIKAFEKELAKFYNNKAIETVKIDDISGTEDQYFNIFDDQEKQGVAVLTSAAGRFDRFDFMIVFNPDLQIKHVKVLMYRSQYGAEITSKNWLKQFYKRKNADFRYGDDIQALSGATLSAQSLTQKINRIKQNINQHFNDSID
ncbi:MAG: FMN-binding protein [Bacteroidota bacterium]